MIKGKGLDVLSKKVKLQSEIMNGIYTFTAF